MQAESDDGLVQVAGHPWTNGDYFKGFSAQALAANILCTSHNSRLSALDAHAEQLWAALREMTRLDTTPGRRVLLNGFDIERWLFKFLCGQLLSGVSRCSDGSRVSSEWFPDQQLAMIADENLWRGNSGCGLFYLSTPNRRDHTPQVRFGAIVSEGHNAVLGARLNICGLEFLLLASARANPDYPEGYVRKHRPGGFRFATEVGQSELLFSWNDGRHHNVIAFARGGIAQASTRLRLL